MREEFIKKMIEAKRMEMEAFQSLVPGDVNKHLEVIGSEIKDMGKNLVRKCVNEAEKVAMCNGTEKKKDTDEKKSNEKVKNVTIE